MNKDMHEAMAMAVMVSEAVKDLSDAGFGAVICTAIDAWCEAHETSYKVVLAKMILSMTKAIEGRDIIEELGLEDFIDDDGFEDIYRRMLEEE